ncbi:TPA: transposase [Bacillus thuringiensis]|nr:hypothetical protein KQ1_05696 [Bacillus cereus BAG3O-1]HDR8174642.1 transposase [Bacillus thuringiensis]
MTKNKRERRTFTAEFKHQMVQLYQNGKPRKDIIKEYGLTPHHWIGGSIKIIRLARLKRKIIRPLNN